ncbi:hypothetical protein AQ616_18775 [Oceanobacillus sp. E9]|uniref:hypothetical protein n=1 Tax=Oceanobacillus sp. E9 TaxID=1742575 RepID=UPI00084E5BB7|nr:hypothetical protein [Oceanobacillus sp. E9]OEH52950.1 hypothetical protein AQ616_18775 [Oceanobacillus sp. E9]
MFTFQIVVQQGMKFAGYLLKEGKGIGGIGNDENGIYVRLREKLNVLEMKKLMEFIEGLNVEFQYRDFDLTFIKD